tara:strand:+ start:108 stop:485 length:378 start_codon:yes stop_codon:yes gene_type:complete
MLIKRFVVVSVLTLMLSSCSTGYETRSQMWNDYEQKTLTYKYAVWGEIYNWKERGFKFGNVASYTDVSLEKAINIVFGTDSCIRGCTILYIKDEPTDEKKQKEILTNYSSPQIVERFFPKKPKRN